jgi:septation ring formation regulator EzrA
MTMDEILVSQLSTVAGLTGTKKIFPVTAPEKNPVPYCIYTLRGSDRLQDLKTGYDGLVEARYDLDLFHLSYSNLVAIKNAIIAKLKTLQHLNLGLNIHETQIGDEQMLYQDKTSQYHASIEVNIYYKEVI